MFLRHQYHQNGSWSPIGNHRSNSTSSMETYRKMSFPREENLFIQPKTDSGNSSIYSISYESELLPRQFYSTNLTNRRSLLSNNENYSDGHQKIEFQQLMAPSLISKSGRVNGVSTLVSDKTSQRGSLESIDLDEEDEDLFEECCLRTAASYDSALISENPSASSSSTPLYFGSPSPTGSSGFHPNESMVQYEQNDLNDSKFPSHFISEKFTSQLGYSDFEEIKLYDQLFEYFQKPKTFDQSNHQTFGNVCSRPVNRFGYDFHDHCKFPLVLPVFTSDLLEKKSFTTWEQIRLQADACLAHWELSAIKNLNRRFQGQSPILGQPSQWITLDPNLFVKNLCRNKNFSLIEQRERHQALKRWSSMEDVSLFIKQQRFNDFFMEPSFQSNENGSGNQVNNRCKTDETLTIDSRKICLRRELSSALVQDLKQQQVHYKANSSLSNHVSHQSIESIVSRTTATTTTTTTSTNSFRTLLNSKMISQWSKNKSLLYRELTSMLESSPTHFVMYVTKFHSEHFRSQFGTFTSHLASLVMMKGIVDLNNPTQTNFKQRQPFQREQSNNNGNSLNGTSFLSALLRFDQVLISAIRAFFYRQSSCRSQTRSLSYLIESACLMRQIQNFHGLNLVVGAIQSPSIYFAQDCWRCLAQRYPTHFRDFCRLSTLCREVSSPQAILMCFTTTSYIPPLSSIIERLRLISLTSWNILEADRRFIEQPSAADWIQKVILNHKCESRPCSLKTSTTSKTSKDNRIDNIFLQYDSIKDSYLNQCNPVKVTKCSDYPESIRSRYLASMPDQIRRRLMSHLEFLIKQEIEKTFGNYRLPEKFY